MILAQNMQPKSFLFRKFDAGNEILRNSSVYVLDDWGCPRNLIYFDSKLLLMSHASDKKDPWGTFTDGGGGGVSDSGEGRTGLRPS